MILADRHTASQAWWLASELARRNSQLRIAETHDRQVGASLSVYDPHDPAAYQVLLNPVAGINVVGAPFSHIDWADTFAPASPHEIVKRLEVELMLRPSEPAPATTDIALVYRTIAHTVNLLVNDRHSWIIRGERPTDDGVLENITWAGDTSWFESLEDLVGRWFEEEPRVLAAQGATHVWALWKDLQPVALFDMYGDVHTLAGRRNLRREYLKHDRHLSAVVGSVLGQYLP